jgi:nucleotide-binding universal stress UspA family protein
MKLLNKILLPVDFDDQAKQIIETGRVLHESFHSHIILLHVLPERLNKQHIGKLVKKAAHTNLDSLKQQLIDADVEDVETVIQYGSVFDKTIDVAEEKEANAILMGPGGENVSDGNYIGTSVEKVIRKTNIPVWLVKKEATNIKRILCPVDFSEPSKRALNNAIMLAENFGAELNILSVFEPETSYSRWIKADLEDENKKAYQTFLEQYDKFLEAFDFKNIKWKKLVVQGVIDEQIIRNVRDHQPDLLIMGTTGRTGLGRILIGSVTEKVIRNVECSVITTKSRNLLDFQFEIGMNELAKHHNEGLEAFSNKEYQVALTHFKLAHDLDKFHIPTLIKLFETYQLMGKKSKARQYKTATIKVLESLWDEQMSQKILDYYRIRKD